MKSFSLKCPVEASNDFDQITMENPSLAHTPLPMPARPAPAPAALPMRPTNSTHKSRENLNTT